jgi:crotonobetainyl-CoA:carnitine CoA-transferase CaiB-like acyl-CoA transferase
MTRKPLEGVRVLDFTWVRAGPWATRWLSVMGAEVIKVEWPDPRLAFTGRGGGLGDAGAGPNAGGHFNDQNADKLSITVNVRSPQGLQIVKDLLKFTDVVIENFSADLMRDWGLGYPASDTPAGTPATRRLARPPRRCPGSPSFPG